MAVDVEIIVCEEGVGDSGEWYVETYTVDDSDWMGHGWMEYEQHLINRAVSQRVNGREGTVFIGLLRYEDDGYDDDDVMDEQRANYNQILRESIDRVDRFR